jgi:hypothetical protein
MILLTPSDIKYIYMVVIELAYFETESFILPIFILGHHNVLPVSLNKQLGNYGLSEF